MRSIVALIAGGLLLAACTNQPAVQPTPTPSHPSSATPSASPSQPSSQAAEVRAEITTTQGMASFRVEVADDAEEMERGLMERTSIAEDAGMVFLYDQPSDGSFWMKDTLIPLTIAFWDKDGRIISILDMQPCTEDPCQLYSPGAPYVGALEVNQGALDGLGVEVGDTVRVSSPQEPSP